MNKVRPVIDPGEQSYDRMNYIVPGALAHGDEVAVPAMARTGQPAEPGLYCSGDGLVSAEGDGRVAVAGSPAYDPPAQLPWGFGLAKAAPAEPTELALTDLGSDYVGFTVRQQDAVRRDIAELLNDYSSYAPVPFAAQDPLTLQYVDGFDGFVARVGDVFGPRQLIG